MEGRGPPQEAGHYSWVNVETGCGSLLCGQTGAQEESWLARRGQRAPRVFPRHHGGTRRRPDSCQRTRFPPSLQRVHGGSWSQAECGGPQGREETGSRSAWAGGPPYTGLGPETTAGEEPWALTGSRCRKHARMPASSAQLRAGRMLCPASSFPDCENKPVPLQKLWKT